MIMKHSITFFLLSCLMLTSVSAQRARPGSASTTKPRLGSGEYTGVIGSQLIPGGISFDDRGRPKEFIISKGSYQCHLFVSRKTVITGQMKSGARVKAAYKNLSNSEMDYGYYFTGDAITVTVIETPGQKSSRQKEKSDNSSGTESTSRKSPGRIFKDSLRSAFNDTFKPGSATESDSAEPQNRNTPTNVQSTLPTTPYEDHGACPFECCTYRRWTVSQETVIRQERQSTSPIAFKVKKGERVIGITGVVITIQPGQAKVLKPITIGGVRVRAGEIVYLLTNIGEGFCKVWYKGRVEEVDISDNLTFKTLREAQSVWWVKVKNSRGQIGWTDQTAHFSGMDNCG